jgi:exodeoxyribonuclease V alpha subunit
MRFVEGTIKQTLFYNEDNSYSVFRVDIGSTDEPDLFHHEPTIIVCGFFPRLEMNQTYRFFGEVTDHPKYGIQYNASRFERVMDMTPSGIIDYLSSDLFKGIGPKTAELIVDQLGLDCLDKIMNDPNVLDSIPRMNDAKKKAIWETLRDNRAMESTLIWLYGFAISPHMAMKIYQKFGFSAIDVIKNDPYVLMDEIENIGFKRADEIALKIGFSEDHPLRIKAVILYLLNEYVNKYGDTYLEKDRLLEYASSYLAANATKPLEADRIEEGFQLLVEAENITEESGYVSLSAIHYAEITLAKRLRLLNQEANGDFDDDLMMLYLDQFESSRAIRYTSMQKKAILTALKEPFSIITGGPGTGKTTIIDAIVHVFLSMHQGKKDIRDLVKLAAPTGKAAKRLQEATDFSATTIHRLLGYDYEGRFAFGLQQPLNAKLIVIDEASMLDVILAYRLFSAIKPSTKIVFVGDDNQLPSVGPGQVLSDMIESDLFSVCQLEQIHRQAADSSIISLAYDILNQSITDQVFTPRPDRIFYVTRESLVADYVIKCIREEISAGYTLLDDIQVLSPLYKGACGIDRLNQLIQERFNRIHSAHKLVYNDKEFRFQDKVMQLVNQPEDGIMNGDQGVVIGIVEDKELHVDFSGNVVVYNAKDLDNLTLAYAVSIHKAQGSEFKVVILPLVNSHTIMLKKKLLYTAITRAKDKLIMIGEKYALQKGVFSKDLPRKTRLTEYLKQSTRDPDEQNMTIEDFL